MKFKFYCWLYEFLLCLWCATEDLCKRLRLPLTIPENIYRYSWRYELYITQVNMPDYKLGINERGVCIIEPPDELPKRQ